MSKWVRKAKEASAIAQYLIARGLKPSVRADFAVEVEIDGLCYVVETLAEAKRITR